MLSIHLRSGETAISLVVPAAMFNALFLIPGVLLSNCPAGHYKRSGPLQEEERAEAGEVVEGASLQRALRGGVSFVWMDWVFGLGILSMAFRSANR